MALTVHDALAQIGHTLGEGDVSAEVDFLTILNAAGHLFFSAHNWVFLRGIEAQVDLVAGQDYVDLPSDLRTLHSIYHVNSLNATVTMVSRDEILLRRHQSVSGQRNFWAAIEFAADANGTPFPRLAIWPTPSTDNTASFAIYYDRGWPQFTDDDGFIPIPTYAEPAFIQVLRAVARGWEEEDEGSLDRRLNEVYVGPVFKILMDRDTSTQRVYGYPTGGVGDGSNGFQLPWWAQSNAGPPS